MAKKIVKEVQKGSDIQTSDKTQEFLDRYNNKYNLLKTEVNGLKSDYKELQSKLNSFIKEIYGEKGDIPELASLIKGQAGDIRKIIEDSINLQSNLDEYSSKIERIYDIVLGPQRSQDLPTFSIANRLENLEKRLNAIEQIEASENINSTLEELKYIPLTKKIESSIPNTPTPQEYPAPSTSVLDNAHEYRLYKRIWNALKGSQTKESESSKTAKWIVRGAAIVSLALGSYLGYLEATKDNKSSKPIKIERTIFLSENCPDMNIIYLNENDKDNLTKGLNSQGYTIYTPSKNYITLSSKEVCKDGAWDEEIYLFNKNHTDIIVNNILNNSASTIEASKNFRKSLESQSTKKVSKSTQQIKKANKSNKKADKSAKQQKIPKSEGIEEQELRFE